MVNTGTLSFEDIYGAGSLDTLPASQSGETQQKVNPNNSETTGMVKKGEENILHVFKGNFLGQPIVVWLGMLAMLVAIKFIAEKEGGD